MSKVVSMLFPVLVMCVGALLSKVNGMEADLIDIKSKMPALITPQGVPTDSPLSAEARGKLKEEINNKIGELNVRVRILEEHEKK